MYLDAMERHLLDGIESSREKLTLCSTFHMHGHFLPHLNHFWRQVCSIFHLERLSILQTSLCIAHYCFVLLINDEKCGQFENTQISISDSFDLNESCLWLLLWLLQWWSGATLIMLEDGKDLRLFASFNTCVIFINNELHNRQQPPKQGSQKQHLGAQHFVLEWPFLSHLSVWSLNWYFTATVAPSFVHCTTMLSETRYASLRAAGHIYKLFTDVLSK